MIKQKITLIVGRIDVDSPFAKQIGFTSANGWVKDCYLWGVPAHNGIILSLLVCKKKGSFKNLIETIQSQGWYFRIPNPSNRILEIAKKQKWNLGNDGKAFFVTNEPYY